MSIYAKDTSVSVEKSRAEIESILSRYGATAFAYATNQEKAMIRFQASGRQIMFVLDLPSLNDKAIKFHTRNGRPQEWRPRGEASARVVWDQACRQKWRCLALAIKAKLEAVASGIATFEDEFLAHIVMPDGKTVASHIKPQIESAYSTGKVPPMLEHF